MYTLNVYYTPPFLPYGCYLSGAPCQTIVRCLSDLPSDICQLSHQKSVRQLPHHCHQTCMAYMVYMWYLHSSLVNKK